MDMVHFLKVQVARDPVVATINEDIPAWVFPVLENVFGEGNVRVMSEFSRHDFELPDPAAEYERLKTVYDGSGNPKVYHVVEVFGAGVRGVNELAKAIREAYEESPAEADPLVA
jgi:hypothetical protein